MRFAVLFAVLLLAALPARAEPPPALSPDQARDLLALLGTASLQGNQVPRFVQIVQTLNAIASPPPSAPAPAPQTGVRKEHN